MTTKQGHQRRDLRMIKTEHEVTRASFQMRDHDISILFLHIMDGGNTEYRAENFRGTVVMTTLNPKATFHNWVLGIIKKELASYEVKT